MTDTTFRSTPSNPCLLGLTGRKLHEAWKILDNNRRDARLRNAGLLTSQGTAVTMNGQPRHQKHRGGRYDGVRIK
jgi:hypothetical protein